MVLIPPSFHKIVFTMAAIFLPTSVSRDREFCPFFDETSRDYETRILFSDTTFFISKWQY